ncbi:MAG: signal recognition particle protein [Chloroflexi bacterium]|nr:signal recognition particle protein [Chloroflexota bacterium]
MFEQLTEKLDGIFNRLGSKGRLTERDVEEALREVRLALLEADVNFRVVREFVGRVRERAVGQEVLQSLTPAQHVVKIVHEELIAMLGQGGRLNTANTPPTIVMLVGLQGSGKTTTAAKLALHLRKNGQRPLLVAADVYRPAAITQLVTLGKQLNIPVYEEGAQADPVAISRNGVRRATETASTVVLLDTAGRLHIDEAMMAEVARIKQTVQPHEVLLVVDAMTGQDAVRAAEEFNTKVGVTGLILTKMDGDARGGAALSIRSVTGVPIKFLGTSEKTDGLEPYHPDRLASRILGMGDMLTLIERAQENFDEAKARELEKKLRQARFDLEDFLDQLRQLKKLGPLTQILEMLPGFNKVARNLPAGANLDDGALKKVEAIILSMTMAERRNPDLIDGSRRRRIARGSGTTPQDVNQLLNQFQQMRKLIQQLTQAQRGGKGSRMSRAQMMDMFRR